MNLIDAEYTRHPFWEYPRMVQRDATNHWAIKRPGRSIMVKRRRHMAVARTQVVSRTCLSCFLSGVGDGAGWVLVDSESGLNSCTLKYPDFCLDNGGEFKTTMRVKYIWISAPVFAIFSTSAQGAGRRRKRCRCIRLDQRRFGE